jgi:hypothetical protein
MFEKITSGKMIFAIIIRYTYRDEGIKFFTPESFSQQLAYMKRPRGHSIEPHVHNEVARRVTLTNEVLFVKSGKILIDFYDNQKRYLESRILNTGDVILLANGGHGLTMLEESEIIEVKQGPYAGDADKTRFKGVPAEKTKAIKR